MQPTSDPIARAAGLPATRSAAAPTSRAPSAPLPGGSDAATAATGLLAALTAGLTSGDDLRALLERFLEPIMQVAGASAAAVRVLDGRDRRMHLVGQIGLPEGVLEVEQTVEHSCGVCGSAVADTQARWADDLESCARRSGGEYFGEACTHLLAIPLRHRGRVLGLLNLFFAGTAMPSSQVQALLKTIGELLGLALDNARLEQETLRNAVLGERQALAAELHDSLGQSLTSVKMRLPLLQDAIESCDLDEARRHFGEVRSAVTEAHATLRGILTQFRAPIDPLGLAHALQVSVEAFRRQTPTSLHYDNRLAALRLAPECEFQVLMIVREALSNVARHARATHAWLTLTPTKGGMVALIEDDGIGLAGVSSDDGIGHFGLQIMRERAARVGGTLSVHARPGGGTRVHLHFPIPETPRRTVANGNAAGTQG